MTSPRTHRPMLIDMDGTLIDSTAIVEQAWRGFASEHGLDLDAILAYAHGRPTHDTVRRFLPDRPDADELADALNAREEATTDGIVEIPGARDFIAALDPDGWALVTSAPRGMAVNRLAAAGIPLPRTCVFADDITHGKPDPEPYLLAARRLGVEASACVALEDAEAGITSARAAGATTIVVGAHDGFDGTLHRVPDLRGLTPGDLAPL